MKKMIAPSMTLLAVFCASSAFATEQKLGTQTGQELGVSLSSYKYEESSLDVKNEGIKLGVDYTTTMAAQNDWFFKINGRVAYGKVDYTGSGHETRRQYLVRTVAPQVDAVEQPVQLIDR